MDRGFDIRLDVLLNDSDNTGHFQHKISSWGDRLKLCLLTVMIIIDVVIVGYLLWFHEDQKWQVLKPREDILKKEDVKLYLIMPTQRRIPQQPLLTTQAQILSRVPNLHLIIIEDSNQTSLEISKLLKSFNLNFTHLACSAVEYCAKVKCNKTMFTGKGAIPRNCGLNWLEYNEDIQDGVIYFADDDNIYTQRLFEEIRKTKKFALFPVGGFPKTWLSGPLVKNGTLADFLDPLPKRHWPLDMAGFSLSVRLWRERKCPRFIFWRALLETSFVSALGIAKEEVEVLADQGTKVYVWHKTYLATHCFNYDPKKLQELEKYDNFKHLSKNFPACSNKDK